jgi:hypothetical protein
VDKGIIPFVRYFISFSIFVSLFFISIHTVKCTPLSRQKMGKFKV